MNDLEQRVAVVPKATESLDHYVTCHDDDLTLCGLDASGLPWADIVNACVVCADLNQQPCGRAPDCWCGCEGS